MIEGRARTRNLQGNYLHVSRDDSDQLFVEKAQVMSRDKMATNGVMHVIDEVILPSDGEANVWLYILVINFGEESVGYHCV